MATIAFDPQIPVFDRFARAWPQHAEGEAATYGAFSEACETAFEWDAHFAAYSAPAVARRLGTAAALVAEPKMVLLVLDVDGPDHKWTPEWWAAEKEKLRALFKKRGFGYAYCTRGGYRIVFGLRDELALREAKDALRWRHSYLDWIAAIQSEFGIICDDKCADWTRLYRLPRVSRDGAPQVPVDELGFANKMLDWREPYCAPDDPRLSVAAVDLEIPVPAPVTEEQLEAAANALVAAWPKRSRHYAGLALCGALAHAGWSDEAITDFVCYVMWQTVGDPEVDKWSKAARATLDKVARGEQVSGWPSLVEHMCSGLDGQKDESRRAAVEAATLASRRAIGQGPPMDLFVEAVAAANPPLADQLDAACAEVGGDVDFRALLDEMATLLEPAIAAAESKAKQVDARPMGMSGREMRGRNLPPTQWIAQHLIPRRGVGAVSGEPKSGKSWDLTYISIAAAAGRSMFGRFAVDRPVGTFYVYLEDPEESVNNRREAIAVGLGVPADGDWLDRWFAQPRGRAIDILNLADLCVLAASVKRAEKLAGRKIELVIVDPLSNAHSGEEDKRDSMRVVMSRLHAVEDVLDVALVFAHHSAKTSSENKGRKRGGQKMRGSSAIHGAVDFGIYVSDVRGDSKQEFIGRVESEVKSARGGGVFDRLIQITDNENGNAIKAVFSAQEPTEEGPQDLVSERAIEVVHKLFTQGGPLTRDQLKAKIKGKGTILAEAIDLACGEGWITQKFAGKHAAGYEITEAGRELVRGGSGGGEPSDDAPPQAPPSDPSMGFLASMLENN